ncbi:hypothetical protein IWQ62_001954 [Dispira parvispora]|uniref:Uncharacterized protein n=1 Tax=Dispira parvispora TaxID=1520584 RepID=A0A9W8ASE8_9FUNG|nr:hypothetical protein IWQ62_001954 [Dispira parvispora]
MTSKLFIMVAFTMFSAFATAKLSSEAQKCLVKCTTSDTFNKCGAACIDISVDIMDEFDRCSYGCTADKNRDPAVVFNCSISCVEEFDSQSKYSYEDISNAMLEFSEDPSRLSKF